MVFNNKMHYYYSFQSILEYFFKTINIMYIVFSFYLLFNYYFKYPKIRFINYYTLYTILCLLPVAIVFVLMFSWLPKQLVKPSLINNYFNYIVPDLNKSILLFNIIPIIVFIAFLSLLFSIYRYNSIETYYHNQDVHINRSFNVASLGIQAMTHSIKNHLLAIQSETEFLKEKYTNDSDALTSLSLITQSYEMSFHVINKAANQLRVITLDLKPMALSESIQKVIECLDQSKVSKIFFSLTEPLHYAYIDAHYLKEAFYNIIDNALDAIENQLNGWIKIKIYTLDHYVVVSFLDNGCGISDDMIDNIFLPFNSTKNSVNNWGIGLSYCHKIITAHDGKIQVESKQNVGTKIKIMLPEIHVKKKGVN